MFFIKNNYFYSNSFIRFTFILKNLNCLSNSLIDKNNTNHFTNEFKSFFSRTDSVKHYPENLSSKPKFFDSSNLEMPFILKSFKLYLKINMQSVKSLKVHGSFFTYYLSFTGGNVSLINIKKFFTLYKNMFYFISNIFYYQLPLLSFGGISFKKEILALNWSYMSHFNFMWRYTKPFLCFAPNKLSDGILYLFKSLKHVNFHTALIIDVFYHSKTIYYLHRTGFYTFGLVPTSTNKYTVNYAIPSSQESMLSQVFFIRFVLLAKKSSERSIFNKHFNNWNFLCSYMLF